MFIDDSDEPNTPGHPARRPQARRQENRASSSQQCQGKNASAILAKDLAETAEKLADGNPVAVVVFANYVATARHAFEILSKKHGRRAILLTGRMRPLDKDDVVSERLAQFDLASDRSRERSLEKPVFVVATQTLEVGADLDFDALVTECAALDALRQRFGRLDRMGRGIDAKAAVLIREDMVKSSDKEPVYGESLSKTWQWLSKRTDDNSEIDMGIAALSELLPSGEELEELNAPSEHAPVMLPAHVDCWGQTMPEPCPSPDPSVFPPGTVAGLGRCPSLLESRHRLLHGSLPRGLPGRPGPVPPVRRRMPGRAAVGVQKMAGRGKSLSGCGVRRGKRAGARHGREPGKRRTRACPPSGQMAREGRSRHRHERKRYPAGRRRRRFPQRKRTGNLWGTFPARPATRRCWTGETAHTPGRAQERSCAFIRTR